MASTTLKAVPFEEVAVDETLYLNKNDLPERRRRKVETQVHNGVEINNFFMGNGPQPAGSWISKDVIVYVDRD